jgi:hypothetical protein
MKNQLLSILIIILFISALPTYLHIDNVIYKSNQITEPEVSFPSEESSKIITHVPLSTRSSTWNQSTYSDFIDCSLDGLEIVDNGPDIYLRLKPTNNYTWLDPKPKPTPERRAECSLAPIHGTDNVLLFGGWNYTKPHQHNSTWIYTLSNNTWWERETPLGLPHATEQQDMASIWGDDKVMLFGGNTLAWTSGDTWIYDYSEDRWINKTVTLIKSPPKRFWHTMATIYGTNKILLYGGYSWLPGPSYIIYNDTWIYDTQQNTWTELMLSRNPDARYLHSMAGIYGDDKVVLFGGYAGTSGAAPSNDTWVFDLSDNAWINRTPNITSDIPPISYYSGLASIHERGDVVLFGGSPYMSDTTWVYNVSRNNWTKTKPNYQPPMPRVGHGMTYIDGTDKILIYGGTGSGYVYNDTWILDTSRYFSSGTVLSQPQDLGPNFSFKSIYFNGSNTVNTTIDFQLRTASTKDGLNLTKFIGPDGTENSYYNRTNTKIWLGHSNDTWVQYKGYLTTMNNNDTPILRNVSIIYNYWPNSDLAYPTNNSITSNNEPNFKWNFNDTDSEYQAAFQVLISNKADFSTIDFDSGEQNTNNTTWQFPNGTQYVEIPDGIWYWKVRTKDNDVDWGLFSELFMFKIDTTFPTSKIINPKNDTYYGTLDMIYGTAFEQPNGTGLDKVEIQIEDMEQNMYWNGSNFGQSENWLIPNGIETWSYDTSNIDWTSGSNYSIRSRAFDLVGNIEFPPQIKIFTFDNEGVIFSGPIPTMDNISTTEFVQVGITIHDNTSMVNASTIRYSISTNEGNYWGPWKSIDYGGLENGKSVDVKLNLTFPNGTDNRIRWRAYDIVGNGPNYSDEYVINVNIPTPPIIPEIRLLDPKNNSRISKSSVELSWEVINNYHLGILFDIKLGTQNPPQNMIKQNYNDTELSIYDLENGQTYYWTVIPKLGENNGTCLSGVWSFKIDIPLPKVTLISPANNSVITSTRPTLVWNVEYSGTEDLIYRVYFDTSQNLNYNQDVTTTYYMPQLGLVDNFTYYWRVVPYVVGLEGYGSEVWLFTVKQIHVDKPKFEIDLVLNPDELEIKPGQILFIEAIVTNLGDLTDNFTVFAEIELGFESKLNVEVYRNKTIEIIPEESKIFLIMISVKKGSGPSVENITITAESELDAKYGLNVWESEELTVVILEKDEDTDQDGVFSSYYFSMLLLIIILIIISIIIVIIVRKKSSKKDSEEGKLQDIITETSPENITTPEPEPSVEPVPVQERQQDITMEE